MNGMSEGWVLMSCDKSMQEKDVIAFYESGNPSARKDFGSSKEAAKQVKKYKKAIWYAFRTKPKVSVHKRGTCIELWRDDA